MNFDDAFHNLLGHEGGYSNHPSDPGGETMWGVTRAVAQEVGYRGDMRELPVDLAKRIYRDKYWDAVKADDMPRMIAYPLFDGSVNSGVSQSAKWLQRCCGAVDDGKIGPRTIAAVWATPAELLLRRMLSERLRFMTGLANWPAFSKGWARRIADLMEVE